MSLRAQEEMSAKCKSVGCKNVRVTSRRVVMSGPGISESGLSIVFWE
jgi:hypothetical protein